MEIGNMIFMLVLFSLDFVAWLTAHLMCEYKYFWCKGCCNKCHNWKCKYFKEGAERGL